MESLNIERQGLLLELVRNITQNKTPGYSDSAIANKVRLYKQLLEDFNKDTRNFPYIKQEKLAELHRYFYGTDFNFENPDDAEEMEDVNIYEQFKETFNKIKKLAESNQVLTESLRKSLNEILETVGYSKKDKYIIDYLNVVIEKAKGLKSSSETISKRISKDTVSDVERKVGDIKSYSMTQTSPITSAAIKNLNQIREPLKQPPVGESEQPSEPPSGQSGQQPPEPPAGQIRQQQPSPNITDYTKKWFQQNLATGDAAMQKFKKDAETQKEKDKKRREYEALLSEVKESYDKEGKPRQVLVDSIISNMESTDMDKIIEYYYIIEYYCQLIDFYITSRGISVIDEINLITEIISSKLKIPVRIISKIPKEMAANKDILNNNKNSIIQLIEIGITLKLKEAIALLKQEQKSMIVRTFQTTNREVIRLTQILFKLKGNYYHFISQDKTILNLFDDLHLETLKSLYDSFIKTSLGFLLEKLNSIIKKTGGGGNNETYDDNDKVHLTDAILAIITIHKDKLQPQTLEFVKTIKITDDFEKPDIKKSYDDFIVDITGNIVTTTFKSSKDDYDIRKLDSYRFLTELKKQTELFDYIRKYPNEDLSKPEIIKKFNQFTETTYTNIKFEKKKNNREILKKELQRIIKDLCNFVIKNYPNNTIAIDISELNNLILSYSFLFFDESKEDLQKELFTLVLGEKTYKEYLFKELIVVVADDNKYEELKTKLGDAFIIGKIKESSFLSTYEKYPKLLIKLLVFYYNKNDIKIEYDETIEDEKLLEFLIDINQTIGKKKISNLVPTSKTTSKALNQFTEEETKILKKVANDDIIDDIDDLQKHLDIYLKLDFDRQSQVYKDIIRYKLEKKITDKLTEVTDDDTATVKSIIKKIEEILMVHQRKIKASLKEFKYFTKAIDIYTKLEKRFELAVKKIEGTEDFLRKIVELDKISKISKSNIEANKKSFITTYKNFVDGLTKTWTFTGVKFETLSDKTAVNEMLKMITKYFQNYLNDNDDETIITQILIILYNLSNDKEITDIKEIYEYMGDDSSKIKSLKDYYKLYYGKPDTITTADITKEDKLIDLLTIYNYYKSNYKGELGKDYIRELLILIARILKVDYVIYHDITKKYLKHYLKAYIRKVYIDTNEYRLSSKELIPLLTEILELLEIKKPKTDEITEYFKVLDINVNKEKTKDLSDEAKINEAIYKINTTCDSKEFNKCLRKHMPGDITQTIGAIIKIKNDEVYKFLTNLLLKYDNNLDSQTKIDFFIYKDTFKPLAEKVKSTIIEKPLDNVIYFTNIFKLLTNYDIKGIKDNDIKRTILYVILFLKFYLDDPFFTVEEYDNIMRLIGTADSTDLTSYYNQIITDVKEKKEVVILKILEEIHKKAYSVEYSFEGKVELDTDRVKCIYLSAYLKLTRNIDDDTLNRIEKSLTIAKNFEYYNVIKKLIKYEENVVLKRLESFYTEVDIQRGDGNNILNVIYHLLFIQSSIEVNQMNTITDIIKILNIIDETTFGDFILNNLDKISIIKTNIQKSQNLTEEQKSELIRIADNQIPPSAPPRDPAAADDDDEGFGFASGGGVTNTFELTEVLKLFFNFVGNQDFEASSITIYKLYFVLNIYGFYNKDQTLTLALKKIIENNKYTDDIILIIKDIISKIMTQTKELFLEYVSSFNEADTIIKNYLANRKLVERYLFINFIYPFYKKVGAVTLKLSINGIHNDINKTKEEIKAEIDDLIAKEDFLFKTEPLTITPPTKDKNLTQDVNYFIQFVYNFTKDTNITIDNMADLNAFIVMEILSSDKTIKITINDMEYEIPNIKNKPYCFSAEDDKPLTVKTTLNENQFELYDLVFIPQNFKYLFSILKRDYYFIDFNITKDYKYKFYINSEIMTFVDKDKGQQPPKRSLINYYYQDYSEAPTMAPLPIFKLTDDPQLSSFITSVTYAIYVSASLFSKVSSYNFVTLVYLYMIIKNSSNEYLGLSTYQGTDFIILRYKEFLNKIEFLSFLKEVLCFMRSQVKLDMDITSFAALFISIKSKNSYLRNQETHLDNEFIKFLYSNPYKGRDVTSDASVIDIYHNFQEIVTLMFENYSETPNENLFNLFFIPVLKGLHERNLFDISKLEKSLLDYNAVILKHKISSKGGAYVLSQQPQQQKQESSQTKEPPEIVEIDKIMDSINVINVFLEKFKKFKETPEFKLDTIPPDSTTDKDTIKKSITNKYNYFIDTIEKFVSDKASEKDKMGTDIYNLDLPDPATDKDFNKRMAYIKSIINSYNEDLIKEIDSYKNGDNPEQKILKELVDELNNIKSKLLPYLSNFKDSSDNLIKASLSYFYKKNDKSQTLFEQISDYLDLYKKNIDAYKNELDKLSKQYDFQKKNIDSLERTFQLLNQPVDYRKKGGAGGKFKDIINQIVEKAKEKEIKDDDINKITNNFKKLKASRGITGDKDGTREEALKDFYDPTGTNLFERILYQYETDSKNSLPEIAKAKLYDTVYDSNLDPEIELAITFYDKLIFIFLIIVFRIIALQLTYKFIDRNTVTTLNNAVIYYTASYIIVFLIVFMIINIDIFRLRLIFNYLNMHSNSIGILIHLLLKIIIGYLVYLLIINISPENKPTKLSTNQKIKLKFKLEILTIAIIVLLLIFILVV
jgi:hypothetical protein